MKIWRFREPSVSELLSEYLVPKWSSTAIWGIEGAALVSDVSWMLRTMALFPDFDRQYGELRILALVPAEGLGQQDMAEAVEWHQIVHGDLLGEGGENEQTGN